MYVGIIIVADTLHTTSYEICNMLVFGYKNFIFAYINFIISKIVENKEITVTMNCLYFDNCLHSDKGPVNSWIPIAKIYIISAEQR